MVKNCLFKSSDDFNVSDCTYQIPTNLFCRYAAGKIRRNINGVLLSVRYQQGQKHLKYINELYEAGKIKSVIDGPYRLDEVPEAFRHFGKGEHKGKIVIRM